ncbi:adenosylcobinamide-GDP ribazoletransferase [Rhodobacteraceae bacterium KMM 6894]|nr:adenosylcobinamide-GDP ribazoletransferase [Rhodobacteraceae bacterium KMM 6894]
MREIDSLMRIGDVTVALSLLSRLPLTGLPVAHARGARAAWAYPLAGLVLGGMAGGAGMIALHLGLPTALAALIMLAALIALTGAMHEDGLADSVDGLWGGWTPARRLEIMKDSHIGTYGVIALILGLGARWGALWALLDVGTGTAVTAVIVAAMLSRAVMPALMWALPHARNDGLSHHVGRVPGQTVLAGVCVASGAALLLTGASAFVALIVAGGVSLGIRAISRAKIGGQTGDILGATQQITEIALLCTLLIQA